MGGTVLRNRAVMPAMGTGYATREGRVTERLKAYLRERAEGGAGPVGMETACFLIAEGRDVTVVDEREQPPLSPLTSHGYFLHRELRRHGTLLLGARVLKVTGSGALIEKDGESREMEADTVVWAVGSEPETAFAESAWEAGVAVVSAGDAVAPRRLLEAVHEGYGAARELLYREVEDGDE